MRPAARLERGDRLDDAAAQDLWTALARVRADDPRVLADAEDAVFGHYLPLARTLADDLATDPVDPVEVEQVAELGLAQAVLRWRQPDSYGFERFARAVIRSQLRRLRPAPGGVTPAVARGAPARDTSRRPNPDGPGPAITLTGPKRTQESPQRSASSQGHRP